MKEFKRPRIISVGVDPGQSKTDPGAIAIYTPHEYGKLAKNWQVQAWPGIQEANRIVWSLTESVKTANNLVPEYEIVVYIETIASRSLHKKVPVKCQHCKRITWTSQSWTPRIDSVLTNRGHWEAILAINGLTWTDIAPVTWQARILPPLLRKRDNPLPMKKRYLQYARGRYPELAKELKREMDSGSAAAVLIAECARMEIKT